MNRQERRRHLKEMTPAQYETRINEIERQIRKDAYEFYKKEYEKQLSESIDNFILTIVYTLHFNEKTKFGGKRIDDFMEDLMATIEGFSDGVYNPDDYKKQLAQDGIFVRKTDSNKK